MFWMWTYWLCGASRNTDPERMELWIKTCNRLTNVEELNND